MEKRKLKLRVAERDNRRYFVAAASGEKIEKAIEEYIGILGFAKSAYVKIEEKNGKTIGSCVRESLEDVRAALAFNGINVEKVSGTIKGLK